MKGIPVVIALYGSTTTQNGREATEAAALYQTFTRWYWNRHRGLAMLVWLQGEQRAVSPICLWCREELEDGHSPDGCRDQIFEQDAVRDDPALTALRTVLREVRPDAPTRLTEGHA